MCWLVVPESAPNATNPKGLALQAATTLSPANPLHPQAASLLGQMRDLRDGSMLLVHGLDDSLVSPHHSLSLAKVGRRCPSTSSCVLCRSWPPGTSSSGSRSTLARTTASGGSRATTTPPRWPSSHSA